MTLQEKRDALDRAARALVAALDLRDKKQAEFDSLYHTQRSELAQSAFEKVDKDTLKGRLEALGYENIPPESLGTLRRARAAPSEPSPGPTVESLLREALDQIWSKPPEGKGWNYCREQFSPLISQALSLHRSEREMDDERWELTLDNKQKYLDEMLRLKRSHEEMAERVRRAKDALTGPASGWAKRFGKAMMVLEGRDKEAT